MRKLLLFLFLVSGFFGFANQPEIEKLIEKAGKTMLLDPKSSFQLAEKTYKNNHPNNNEKIRLLFIMMNTSSMLQKPLDVISYGNKALAIKSGDVVTRIKILSILGNSYQSIKLNEKTRVYLDKAERLLSSKKIPDSLSYIKGNIYYLKAMNYFNSVDSGIALSYFDKAISQYISSNHPIAEINLKVAYLNRGFMLIDQKKLVEAAKSLQLAGINNDGTARSYPQQFVQRQEVFIEFGKAKILSIEKKPDLSNEILMKILKTGSNDAAVQDTENEIYEILADNFLQKKDIQKHQYYNDLFLIENAKTSQAIALLVNQLISQEEGYYKAENEVTFHKYLYAIIFSTFFFLLIICYLLVKNTKIKRKRDLLEKTVLDHL